jgi:methionine sulfoxide reductase heme-binding subunit
VSAGTHLFWITSRAAGTAAVIAASASVAIGIMMARRVAGQGRLGDLRAVHEALSLVALGLIGLHGVALLGDSFLDPGLAGITVPFAGSYRPLWTGIGIIGGYGLAALGLSYYARDRIGPARWRRLHRFTALFWALGIVHSIGAGSDAGQLWFLAAAGLPAAVALTLVLGRLTRGLGRALDLPRPEPPVRGGTGA